MAWTVEKDWAYTTNGGASLPLPKVSFSTNYVEKSGEKDGVTFADASAPIDRPALTHVEFHTRNNIYQNTGIDRAYWAPSVRGFNLYLQQMATYKVTDGTSSFYAPLSCAVSFKSLAHEAITADVVKDFIAYTVAQWFKEGVVTSDRIAAFMRGSLDLTK